MYRIQEFAKITGLPTTTLRYYDNEGLLKPSIRKENNYRYYGEKEYEKAKIIAALRENNFSIAEIRDVLATISANNFKELSYYLVEKKDRSTKSPKSTVITALPFARDSERRCSKKRLIFGQFSK